MEKNIDTSLLLEKVMDRLVRLDRDASLIGQCGSDRIGIHH